MERKDNRQMENILESVRLSYVSRQQYLETEIQQSKEEGKDTSQFEVAVKKLLDEKNSPEGEQKAIEIYEALKKAPVRSDFCYEEPEELDEIIALFPKDAPKPVKDAKARLLGAWIGRAAGCLLGQPVEGWTRERIVGFAKATENYPIKKYFSSDVSEEVRKEFQVEDYPGAYGNEKKSWLNNISCMPEDDDTNYSVMGLSVVEKYGRDFTPMDVAEFLTTNIPIFLTCTAERMAYKNIINGILPPYSASYGNPYREWLGAQIRVDGYSYVNMGNPYEAARMAVRDAAISHRKNGIYASAFCAALIAECATAESMESALEYALSFLPKKSRLYHALIGFLKQWKEQPDTETRIRSIHEQYDETNLHEWCHVIPNDMIICLALLNGGNDFSKVISIAVEAGFDTDCNAATAASAFGMMYGIDSIPKVWSEPLNGKMVSRIGSGGTVTFEELAERCLNQQKRV